MSTISGMSGYMDYSSVFTSQLSTTGKSTAADALESTLSQTKLENSTDEELMDVCKSFEAYFVEQVMKEAKKTIKFDDEEENKYIEFFGDTMYQEYAGMIADRGDLGIAKMLYDSMKRNGL